MYPNAKATLTSFKSALKASDWSRALSLCTQAVKHEADKHDTVAEFCRTVLPVEEIAALKTFRAYANKSKRIGGEVLDLEYRWSVSLKNTDDVYWFCSLRKEDAQWKLDFPPEPLSQYVTGVLADRKRKAEEYRRRRDVLLPKLKDLKLTLTPLEPSFTLGWPMLFRLEMTNDGAETLYYDRQQVKVNDPMLVRDSKGRAIKYTAGPVQTAGADLPIKPGQTVVLFNNFDLASKYRIRRPGTYTVQFSGKGLTLGHKEPNVPTEYGENHPTFSLHGTCPSNIVQIEVRRPDK
jgi:hypothetical protein